METSVATKVRLIECPGHPELVRNYNISRKRGMVEAKGAFSLFLLSLPVSKKLIKHNSLFSRSSL